MRGKLVVILLLPTCINFDEVFREVTQQGQDRFDLCILGRGVLFSALLVEETSSKK